MKYLLKNGQCGTETAFKIIGNCWKPRILDFCGNNQKVTYTTLKSNLTGISDSTLSRQLKSLLADELIEKQPDNSYLLNRKGSDILPAMKLMQELAHLCNYQADGLNSSVEYTKKIIGSKWKSRIIWVMHTQKSIRFNMLKNSIEGISHKVLHEQLENLEKYSLINRIDYSTKCPHVEYELTEKGELAYQIIQMLADWCIKYDLINPTIIINY